MASSAILTPEAANYGRDPQGAAKARDEWQKQMGNNDREEGFVQNGIDYARGQYTGQRGPQATEDSRLAGNAASGAGGHQNGAVGLARGLAMGQGPSAGAMQLQAGLNASSDMQSAMGRSGRGAAALATGGANAQANTANLQQNAFSSAGQLRAQEMAQGRAMYGGLLGTQREQDTARIGLANDMAQYNAKANDAYRLGMGNAGLQLGDVQNQQQGQDLNYYQGGMGPVNAQTQAQQAYRSWLANAQKAKIASNIEEQDSGGGFELPF